MCCEDCPSYSECQEANLLSSSCCPNCSLYDICANPIDEYQEEDRATYNGEFISDFDTDYESDALMEYQYLNSQNGTFDFDEEF